MNSDSFKRKLRILKRKKWPAVLAVIIIAVLILTPLFYTVFENHKRFSATSPIPLSDAFVKHTDREKIHLTAHRGFSCQAPENTIPAVEKANEYGFDTVEIDVRQTEDGVWVVSHDEKLSVTTDGNGRFSSKTYYDIVTFNIKKGANYKKYENLKIPSLEHLLKACLEYNIKPMIDIKSYSQSGIDSLLDIIERNGFTKSCSIVSSDRDILETIREKNKEIKLYKLADKLNSKEIKNALAEPSIGISFDADKKINTAPKIKKLLNADIDLICRGTDDVQTIRRFYSLGVTEFVTGRIYDKQ